MKTQKIRLGILLDSDRIPAWQHCLIQQIMLSDVAELKLILIADPTDDLNLSTKPGRLYRAVARYEHRLHKAAHDACMTTSIDIMMGEFEWIRLPPEVASDLSLYKATISKEIRDHALDVIVALGGLHLVGPLSSVSNFGVWYFRHGYGQTCRVDGSSVGFWEVIKRRPHIHSALVIQRPGGNELIAYESYSATRATSQFLSRNEHLWKILYFVPRALQRLQNIGPESFLRELVDAPHNESIEESAREWRLSNSNLFMPIMFYALWYVWHKVSERFGKERWELMYSMSGNTDDFRQFKLMHPPKGRFWADPFALHYDGDVYVFFEDASIMTGRGHISVMRMESSGAFSSPTKILERPYHLSYPFVFEWRDEIYLVPESAENRSIELYRCIKFPNHWEFEHHLMNDILAYDTTLVEHDGLWWLFTSVQQNAGASNWDELSLFHSDSPISQVWHSHPMNPIVSDVRRARSAGKIFLEDGHLYRPSQNSSHRYGFGLSINKILELSKTTYREKVVRTIEPNWSRSVKAVHTINRDDWLVIIDVIFRSRFKR